MIFHLGLLEDQGKALEELGENYKRLFPVLMTYQFNMGLISEEAVLKVTEKIRERYFKQEKIGKSTFTQIKEVRIKTLTQLSLDSRRDLNFSDYDRVK